MHFLPQLSDFITNFQDFVNILSLSTRGSVSAHKLVNITLLTLVQATWYTAVPTGVADLYPLLCFFFSNRLESDARMSSNRHYVVIYTRYVVVFPRWQAVYVLIVVFFRHLAQCRLTPDVT